MTTLKEQLWAYWSEKHAPLPGFPLEVGDQMREEIIALLSRDTIAIPYDPQNAAVDFLTEMGFTINIDPVDCWQAQIEEIND